MLPPPKISKREKYSSLSTLLFFLKEIQNGQEEPNKRNSAQQVTLFGKPLYHCRHKMLFTWPENLGNGMERGNSISGRIPATPLSHQETPRIQTWVTPSIPSCSISRDQWKPHPYQKIKEAKIALNWL